MVYSASTNEYLVAWEGDTNSGVLLDDQYFILGQRIDALTGAEAGTDDLRLSDTAPSGTTAWSATVPLKIPRSGIAH